MANRFKDDAAYQAHKQKASERQREISAQGRDIGPIPPIVDPERRTKAEGDLEYFAKTYFPHKFTLEFSDCHKEAISLIQVTADDGGLYAYAMPRGSGKTSLAEVAAIWAAFTGRRKFVVVIGATGDHAALILGSIVNELETNDLLLEDFPEACYPFRRLEGEARRASGQTLGGVRTKIKLSKESISFALVPGAKCSGAHINTAGITGQIRGLKIDGVRPDFVILDDPQTDESAKSVTQNRSRAEIIERAILGLAGPGKSIACIMPCTVIAQGDMVDQFLDHELHPEWRGQRVALMGKFPKNMALWTAYKKIRDEEKLSNTKGKANEFYGANRAAMDDGARVMWPERFNPDQISAVQNCMDLFLTNAEAFFAEYQNQPRKQEIGLGIQIEPEQIRNRLNHLPRGVCPEISTRLVAFIDVGGELLYYTVLAMNESNGGAIVDYGTFPEQRAKYFENRKPNPGMSSLETMRGYTEKQRIFSGLTTLVEQLTTQAFPRDGGGEPLVMTQILIDSGWESKTVHEMIRQNPHRAIILASKGMSTKSSTKPMSEWPRRPGERIGHEWRVTRGDTRARFVIFDADYWKSKAIEKLTMPPGGGSEITIFGSNPKDHELFADHLTAEYSEVIEAKGRRMTIWRPKPDNRDNHYFDTCVGGIVAAGVAGSKEPEIPQVGGAAAPAPTKRTKVKLSEKFKEKFGDV